MEQNVGTIDRAARIIVGAALVGLANWGSFTGVTQIVMVFFGIILLATGIMGYCPMYVPLGKNTAEKAKAAPAASKAKKRK